MACNCATSEQLNELYRRYGEKKSERRSLGIRMRYFAQKVGVGFCMVFIFPAIVFYVIHKMWCTDNNRINIKEFFKLKGKGASSYVG